MDARTKNNVTVTGTPGAAPLVLIHGFGCDQSVWRDVAPAFEPTRTVVRLDLVGCGGAEPTAYDPVRHGTLQGYADDVIDVLDELDLGPAVLMGHSVSAMIVALVAIRRPELVERLVLVAPNARYTDDPEQGYEGGFTADALGELLAVLDANYVGWASLVAPVVGGDATVAGEVEELFCQGDPEISRRFAHVTFSSDNRADLPAVPVPALVLQVTQDVLAPVSAGRYVAEHLPEAELVLIDGVGHCPHLSNPAEVVGAVTRYLAAPAGADRQAP